MENGTAANPIVGASQPASPSAATAPTPLQRVPPVGTVRTNDGVDLCFERFGSHGPVVILIHGWSGSRHYWDLNVRPIARTCQVITYDLRHHGDSGRPGFGFHVARLASDLKDLLTTLRLEDVTLVGSSMGAAIIWSYLELFGYS